MFESVPNLLVESEASFKFWLGIRKIEALLDVVNEPIWRLSVPPATGAAVVQQLGATRYVMDWGGGLIWAALPMRPQLKSGHATLMRGPEMQRLDEKSFTIDGSAALMAQVKQAFDPNRIFNRGRMVEGL
jgi:glycolate oxidase FAD binding subunit